MMRSWRKKGQMSNHSKARVDFSQLGGLIKDIVDKETEDSIDKEADTLECFVCGSKHVEIKQESGLVHDTYYYAQCQDCGVRSIPCDTKDEVIEWWNDSAQKIVDKFMQYDM